MYTRRSVLIAMFTVGSLLVPAAAAVAGIDRSATGVIKVEGKLLETGKIAFYRDDGQFVGSKVKDGKYTIDRIPAGTLRVTIEGEGVPNQYATEETTPLVVQLQEGENTFDFDLK